MPSTGDGVREHRFGHGIGVPRAARYYGPFWALPCTRPALGLSVINTLLDHATTVRYEKLSVLPDLGTSPPESMRIDMDLLCLGPQVYEGDAHVYAWYRAGPPRRVSRTWWSSGFPGPSASGAPSTL